jgi:hypothetical protein
LISAKLIRRIELKFSAETLHSDDGKEVEDDEEEAAVGGEAREDVDDGVDHDPEVTDGVEDLKDPANSKNHPQFALSENLFVVVTDEEVK